MKNKILKLAVSAFILVGASASLTSCGNSVANAGEAFEMKTLDDLRANSTEDKPIQVSFWHSFGHNIASQLEPHLLRVSKKKWLNKKSILKLMLKQLVVDMMA